MLVKKIVGVLVLFNASFSLCSQENSSSLPIQDALNFPRYQKNRSPFFVVTNPSILAYFSSSSWAISAERRNAIPGWLQGHGIGILSSKAGNWALGGEISSLVGFSRQQLSISHARKLAEGVHLGLSLGANSFKATGYKTHWSLVSSLGSFIELSEVLSVGCTASAHFLNQGLREKRTAPDWKFLFTLQYEPSSKICFSGWSVKKTGVPTNMGFSFRYLLQENISLIAGIAVHQPLSWFGISIRRKKLVVNLQAGWHPMLGISNNICLYGFNS